MNAKKNWQDVFPRSIIDPKGPRGEPVTATTDRRLLWHIEGWLAVNGTNEGQHRVRLAIYRYLCDTCEHHWLDYEGDETIPAHKQCLWCNDVDWLDGSHVRD